MTANADSVTPRVPAFDADTFHHLLELLPDAVVIIDPDGRIAAVNAQTEEVFHYARGELLGQPVECLLPERLRALHRRHRTAYAAEPRTRPMGVGLELAGRRRDGAEFPVEISLSPLAREGHAFVIAVIRDVTDRTRVEERLRKSEAALAEAQQIAHLGSWEWDIRANTVIWSDELYRIYGLTPHAFGESYEAVLQRVHRDDRAFFQRVVESALRESLPFDFEYRIVRPDGAIRVLHARGEMVTDAHGQPLRMVGTGQDITERVEAAERRQELIREQAARAEAEAGQQRLAFLTEASAILFSSLDYETTLASVARLMVPTLADLCVVDMLHDPAIRPIAVAHVDPQAEQLLLEMRRRYPLDLSSAAPVARVMRSGQSLLFPVVADELQASISRDETQFDMLRRLAYRSAMVVPLLARGKILGTMMIVSTSVERRYGPDDLALAEELARRAAIAIDNARLYAGELRTRLAAERTADRIARLQQVTASIAGALTPSQIAEIVVDQGVDALGAVAGSLLLLSEEEPVLETIAAKGYPPEVLESWLQIPIDVPVQATEAVRTRMPVWIRNWEEATTRYPVLSGALTTGSQSFAAIPLLVEDRAIGVMGLSFPEPRDFGADDRSFMVTLASQCALAIERARLYDAERQARAEAEAAARVREEFLSIASHELKTPLTSIKAAAQLVDRRLAAEGVQDDRIHKLSGQLRSEIDRLERLVSDLLDVSRIQRGRLELRPEPFDLLELTREVVERFEATTERKRDHTIEVVAAGSIHGAWDRGRLDQVLSNLLSNALKYSPQGGDVRIQLRRDDDWVDLAVSDQGIGIPAAEQMRLFQPFARGEAARMMTGGAGLGLYITATIVEQHGGTIAAESEPGKGATFTVRLPRVVGMGDEGRGTGK